MEGVALLNVLVLVALQIPGALTLTLNMISVPPHQTVGTDAELRCEFDMEGETLYSVKWYKDDHEFYRFVPNEHPQLQVFPVNGIHVDRHRSSREKVVLKRLSLDTAGTYKCEVSAEAPNFRTKSDKQDMVVVVTPSKAEIVGARPKYQVGDIVNVTPIYETFGEYNGVQSQRRQEGGYRDGGYRKTDSGVRRMPSEMAELREYHPRVESDGLETSVLGLLFKVKQHHLGGLKLECTSSIGSVYWQSFQEKIPIAPREQPATSGNWWRSANPASKIGIGEAKKMINGHRLTTARLLKHASMTYDAVKYVPTSEVPEHDKNEVIVRTDSLAKAMLNFDAVLDATKCVDDPDAEKATEDPETYSTSVSEIYSEIRRWITEVERASTASQVRFDRILPTNPPAQYRPVAKAPPALQEDVDIRRFDDWRSSFLIYIKVVGVLERPREHQVSTLWTFFAPEMLSIVQDVYGIPEDT
eukprot:maker-scaffold9_size846264-snap-gene-4.19 protein:Tk08395 transcript:maker-scaffold9_size846264-snap-gene-4.19-mRNA-1 annotation:"beat protein"